MLDIVERYIWFFLKHYLPMRVRYAYQQPHFVLLGKNETAKDISIALKFLDVEITRDYAERLKFEFDH